MTRTGFVFANLFRKKTRTSLTLLSIVMAFLLFGLLQAVNVMFSAGADFIGASRLITQARVSFTQSLPMRLMPQIESVTGVKRVNWLQWFGGVVGDNDPIVMFATDPARLHDTYPEWVMSDAQWKAFADTRTGLIVGKQMAEHYHWKIGQKIPMKSNIFPNKDGSKNWPLDLVGIYDGSTDQWKKQTNLAYMNYAYYDEANQFGKGRAGMFVIQLADENNAGQVAKTIDAMFENSPDETKTQTEKDFNIGFIKQIGDIGLMVRWILFAVFFTLLLVVGNTMAQSVRERVPELAVLKTLGFSDGTVLGFVMAETLILCTLGGMLGLAIATALGIAVEKAAGGQLPLSVDPTVWVEGGIAILLLSVVVGLLPALRASRLKIVDALAGR